MIRQLLKGLLCLIVVLILSACSFIRVVPKGKQPSALLRGRRAQEHAVVASLPRTIDLPPGEKEVSFDYILGAEDLIEVLVWKNADLSRTVSVRPDGKVSLPLIGDIQAAGLTATNLRDSIKQRLREYKETPEVSVIIKEINSFSVFVMGEVVRPGKLQLRAATTLLQAITMAGGFTQYADMDKILVLRREEGKETRLKVSYNDIITGKNLSGNVILKRGDTILVP